MSNFNNVLDKISLYLENSNFNKSKPIKNTFNKLPPPNAYAHGSGFTGEPSRLVSNRL